jgi:hypothetical protein
MINNSSSDSFTDSPKESLTISKDIEQAILDSQQLISHLSKSGTVELNPEITRVLIAAKYKLEKKDWTVYEENEFLLSFDKLTSQAYPVTIDSLNAIVLPTSSNKNDKKVSGKSQADKAVSWYRRYTMITLLVLLTTQVYWLVGYDLRSNLQGLFDQREITLDAIALDPIVLGGNLDVDQPLLAKQLSLQNQKLDANYKLLMLWNQVWLMGGVFNDSMPKYFQAKYEQQRRVLERSGEGNTQQLEQLDLERNLHQVRMVLFEYILATDYILKAFQEYFLPLLYGLFGAFIYVLRNLMIEIKQRTYSYDCEVKYRLRLTLGALGGMIVGWFFQPDEADAIASLSPMALAFLMGYNIELLFTIMDRVIDNIRQAVDKSETKKDNVAPGTK